MTSVLDLAKQRLKMIEHEIGELSFEQSELETFIRIYRQFSEPQPETRPAAQMQVVSERDDSMHPSGRTGSIDDGQPIHETQVHSGQVPPFLPEAATGDDAGADALGPQSTAARTDVPLEAMHDASPDSAAAGGKTSAEAAAKLGAGTQAPPVDTHAPHTEAIAEPATLLPAGSAPHSPERFRLAPKRPSRGAPKAPDDPTSLKNRVIALHKEHPEFTAQMAAEYLNANQSSVQSYASVLGFKWVTKTEHEARERERANFRGTDALIDHYAEGRKRLGVGA